MAFRIGEKVVCIEEEMGDCGNIREPLKGDIATVTNVYVDGWGYLNLELAEFPAPDTPEYFAGWHAIYFRPVVERKTDISIFTEMLKPTQIDKIVVEIEDGLREMWCNQPK